MLRCVLRFQSLRAEQNYLLSPVPAARYQGWCRKNLKEDDFELMKSQSASAELLLMRIIVSCKCDLMATNVNCKTKHSEMKVEVKLRFDENVMEVPGISLAGSLC